MIPPAITSTRTALRVMFENDSYSVREDDGHLMYSVIATSTASFDYQVVITGVDGTATCELIGCAVYIHVE